MHREFKQLAQGHTALTHDTARIWTQDLNSTLYSRALTNRLRSSALCWVLQPLTLPLCSSSPEACARLLGFPVFLMCPCSGNGNPLQCSCLENPRDGGAWCAAVYGVVQSRTRLKRLSSRSSQQLRNPFPILSVFLQLRYKLPWDRCGIII